jgi:hypothetical protein
MDLQHLYPKRGDDVLEWWEKVIAWAKSLTVEIGPGMMASQGLNGLQILVQADEPLRTPFRVGLGGSRVTVSAGFVGERVPHVLVGDVAVRLDGTGPDGITPVASGNLPQLDLYRINAKPGPDGRGAVAIRMQVDERGIPLDDRKTPEALQVVYVAEFDAAARREMAREGIAIEPLAIVYWTQGAKPAPDRIGQIVRHNLVHSYAPGGEGEPGRHFFSAR